MAVATLYKKGTKKFWFAVIFALTFETIGAVMAWLGVPLDDVTLNIMFSIFGGYITANIFSKVYTDLKGDKKSEGGVTAETTDGEKVVIKQTSAAQPLEGYKKFIYSLILGVYVCVIICVLKFNGKVIEPNFFKLTSFVYLGFLLGDIAEKYSDFVNKIPNLFAAKNKKKEKKDE